MNRLTRLSEDHGFYVSDSIAGQVAQEDYYGEAIEKLAKFENLQDHLIARHHAIPSELEALRSAGKGKTVTFKELLTEKLVTDMLLTQLERHGLK